MPCFPVFVSSPPGFAWRPRFFRLRALSAQVLRGFGCCGVGCLARFCLAISFSSFSFRQRRVGLQGAPPRQAASRTGGEEGRQLQGSRRASGRASRPLGGLKVGACWLLAAWFAVDGEGRAGRTADQETSGAVDEQAGGDSVNSRSHSSSTVLASVLCRMHRVSSARKLAECCQLSCPLSRQSFASLGQAARACDGFVPSWPEST